MSRAPSAPALPLRRRPARPRVRRFGFRHAALLPLIVCLLLFMVYPAIELIQLALSTVTPEGGEFVKSYAGLDNLRTAFDDPIFGKAVWHTFVFVAGSVAIQLILGTALALAIERAHRLSKIARSVLLWPAIVTPVAVSVTWFLILEVEFGLLNRILDGLGLPVQTWLASPTWALPALILVDVWHWTPLVMLVVLAGLANIDRGLYDAARVDGASEWRILWKITLPLLAPTLAVVAVARAVLGFKVFDEIYILTSGGPAQSTEMISTYVRKVFVDQVNFGYGAMLGLIVVVVFALGVAVYGGWRLGRGRTSA